MRLIRASSEPPPAAPGTLRPWLWLALASFGLSSLYALVLIAARIPGLSGWLPADTFRRALVLHVDLSLLLWFAAGAVLVWLQQFRTSLSWPAPATALGVLLMVTASLLPGAAPLLNNYLPVLDAFGFFAGLLLVALAVSRMALAVLDRWRRDPGHRDWPRQLGATAAVLWLVSLGLVALEWARLARQGTALGAVYFEQLFWNAGHVLQFVHTVLLLACWWTLYAGTDRGQQAFLQRHRGWLLPGLVLTLAAPLLPLLAAVVDLSERTLYTAWMALSGWVLVVPFAGLLLYRLHRTGGPDPLARQVIRLSAMLYLAGAVAGSFIRGDDMLVPAHYHGVIGAVTLAYMGMIYRLLDLLGAERPERRACLAQVGLYGTGLLLLILGLAWSGWLGLARKAPEALLAAPAWSGIGTGLMTIGGAVGIAAALWFVAICIRALRTRPERGPAPAGDPAPRLDRR